MNYPLISEYVRSIRLSEDNFDKLGNLRPVLGEDGSPVMSSGNFAVVFKMEDVQSGKLYAVKCFLREQEGREDSYRLIASELEFVSSTFLTSIKYIEKELYVNTTQGNDTEFPVLLMDWIEGPTLDKYIRENIHDTYKLALISYQFCRMASWLLSQDFAHGDLKPDNIIVRDDGQLVLVDYDGMFVPAMSGQKSRELGSVDYRHPLRTDDVFNGSIDDFSIASIALSLKAISLKPELLNEFGADDRLLLCARDYQNIGESECMKAIQNLASDAELAQLMGLFYIAYARNELGNVSFRLFNIAKPEYVPVAVPEEELSTEVSKEDLADAIEDEYGVKYSRDGLRLLRAPKDIESYKIKTGTKIICNKTFDWCLSLQELEIPSSVTSLGDCAFRDCESLQELVIPSSVTSIGDSAFERCSSLRELVIPSSVMSIGSGAFSDCSSLQLKIESSKFGLVDDCIIVDLERKEVVSCLNNKSAIRIPSSVTSIGRSAFSGCSSLQELVIPSSVTSIGSYAFRGCSSLRELVIPSSVTHMGSGMAFSRCSSLRTLVIPPSVTRISSLDFRECKSLQELVIPPSVTLICTGTFNDCSSLRLEIQSSKFVLVDGCIIVDLERKQVISCLNNKSSIIIPSSVTSIGDSAFSGCSSLRELVIPPSVTSIGHNALAGCESLQSIVVPKGQTAKFRELLRNANCDLSIIKEQD